MNNRIISLLSALTAIALAMVARGAFAAVGFTVPQLPESPYDDTEIATNFVISAQFDNARAFGVSLDFDATATNTLELAFGVDDDSNGELAWNETDFILDSPARSPVDETRKAEIKALCNAVCVAYSNCEYGVIVKFEDELPQVLESLPDNEFAQVTAGVYKFLSSELSGKHTTPHRFDDLENFSSRAKTDIAAMRLYGKVCLRRKAGGDMSCRLEALLLKRLTSYREFFAAEGRAEFVRIADEFVSEWICHIESSQGFSRAEALYWLEYSRIWGQDAHGKQEEWAVLRNKAIRQGAKWLVNVGYTPKWIKELEKIENGKDHVQ